MRIFSLISFAAMLTAGCGFDETDAGTGDGPGDGPSDGPGDGPGDGGDDGLYGCSPEYVLFGPDGDPLPTTPHAEVFGAVEYIDGDAQTMPVGPDPRHVHLSWPGTDTSRSVGVVWVTDLGTEASQIQWAEGADLSAEEVAAGSTSEGISYTFGGADNDLYRSHEVKLCGEMTPGVTYSYRVGGEGHWSDVYTFTMPGEPGSFGTFTAVISGDSRGSYEEWGDLVQAMASHDPDLFLFSGDMVELGQNQREWWSWFEAAGDVFAESFFVPAHGNHEAKATNYFAQFSLPDNEQWFSIDYGAMQVVSLMDSFVDQETMQFDQVQFLEDRAGNSDATWKLVMHHKPIYSTCTTHGSYEEARGWWEGTIQATGVDFVLAGHNHIYERSKPIKDQQPVGLGEGTMYLVSGGAGAELYTNTEDLWFGEVANPITHYILAEFTPEKVTMTAYRLDSGQAFDSFEVPAN